MALMSSPFSVKHRSTAQVMRSVIYATVPGAATLCYFFGWGVLIHLALAVVVALGCEALVLILRQRPVKKALQDYSAVLTAILLALAIPPLAPWWITLIGVGFAIIVAKQLYGGLGLNPFNPAMIGYVLLLISFPVEMTSWSPDKSHTLHSLHFLDTLGIIFTDQSTGGFTLSQARELIDGRTAATALDLVKTDYKQGLDTATILALAGDTQSGMAEYTINAHRAMLGVFGGQAWEWVNLAFLLGGLYLLVTRIIDWRIPLSFILGLGLTAGLFHLISSDNYPPVWFHLFSGGTMLGAFFIATDPVTACTTIKGRLIYGASIGFFIFIIRTFGGYPDAIAFSVLLLNMAAPTIDHLCRPRSYGHQSGAK